MLIRILADSFSFETTTGCYVVSRDSKYLLSDVHHELISAFLLAILPEPQRCRRIKFRWCLQQVRWNEDVIEEI